MLKRNIALLIAAGLLSAQAGVASAEFAGAYQLLPAQAKYFAEREAANPNPTGASGNVVPPFTGGFWAPQLPAVERYLAQREATIGKDVVVAKAIFPPDCMASSPN